MLAKWSEGKTFLLAFHVRKSQKPLSIDSDLSPSEVKILNSIAVRKRGTIVLFMIL